MNTRGGPGREKRTARRVTECGMCHTQGGPATNGPQVHANPPLLDITVAVAQRAVLLMTRPKGPVGIKLCKVAALLHKRPNGARIHRSFISRSSICLETVVVFGMRRGSSDQRQHASTHLVSHNHFSPIRRPISRIHSICTVLILWRTPIHQGESQDGCGLNTIHPRRIIPKPNPLIRHGRTFGINEALDCGLVMSPFEYRGKSLSDARLRNPSLTNALAK